MKRSVQMLLSLCIGLSTFSAVAQTAYFIDGYHGGVYGHYPRGYTRFVLDQLKAHPFWKINLEIEPETWDSVLLWEPQALKELQALAEDQSATGRIEYVNPAYGQPYFFNISGESIIRHFAYGIRKVKAYFPQARFSTYSSEEPCFTSALPQILTSFGYRYASLKNPNTCWGGYTRAYGGELVNWIGPDGTRLTTVPRYATEGLLPQSTWQTEGWVNSPQYIKAALAYGIQHPVAMTLQDAGWRNGPWIGSGNRGYQPTVYTTWRAYFEQQSSRQAKQDWKFSQEDVQVSLVWGSQVLQQLAQRVRAAENKLVLAEKMAALQKVYAGASWPQPALDEAWRNLMLAQHHDCWIVPYNGRRGDTWADKVKVWTQKTGAISDSLLHRTDGPPAHQEATAFRVYNTTGSQRQEWVEVPVPEGRPAGTTSVGDERGRAVPAQSVANANGEVLYIKAVVPAFGYTTYQLLDQKPSTARGAQATVTAEGNIRLETDLYVLLLDKSRGGAIQSLVAKHLNGKELVDAGHENGFNTLKGHFFNDGGVHRTSDQPVTLTLLENGPAVVKAEVRGTLLGQPFRQTVQLKQGDRRIDCTLRIDWQKNLGIGDPYKQSGGLDPKDYRKPFYDDRQKLLALFPLNFSAQQVYKDAPFDVTESQLDDTFFSTWDSIKNNIVLNWVDVYDAGEDLGLALLTDHTTTYTHGKDFPLGLNVQYSGYGLWGRNHTLTGPTELTYALVPHRGKWDKGAISQEAAFWNEPLIVLPGSAAAGRAKSLVDLTGTGYQITAVQADGADLLVRLYNAEGTDAPRKVRVGGFAASAQLEELNGTLRQPVRLDRRNNTTTLTLSMPRFGLRTVRLKNFTAG